MNSDSENFEQLRRLFAVKRHEEPPPGYFDRFPREVIARIKAGERGASSDGNWLQRLWMVMEAKPIIAGAFGASICAVLISGILNSEETGNSSVSSTNPLLAPGDNPFSPAAVSLNQESATDSCLSTNPVASLNSLFDFHLTAQPVSYNLQTGN